MAEPSLSEIVEAKRAEFAAAGFDFSAWEPRALADLPLCEVDEHQRLAPHGDPLMDAISGRTRLDVTPRNAP